MKLSFESKHNFLIEFENVQKFTVQKNLCLCFHHINNNRLKSIN